MTATVTDWIAYAADRGLTVADDAASAQALVRASDYIRARTLRHTGISDAAKDEATYIAAAYELETPGFWSQTYTPGQAKVLTKVDKIEWDVVATGITGVDAMRPTSPMIEALLQPTGVMGLGIYVI